MDDDYNYDDDDLVEIPELDDIDKEKTPEVLKSELEEYVVKYIKYDNLIRDKQKQVRALTKQREPCEKAILKYMDLLEDNSIEITGGKLIKNRSEQKVPLSSDIIKGAIENNVKEPAVTNTIIKQMEKRPKKMRVYLKRTSERKAT